MPRFLLSFSLLLLLSFFVRADEIVFPPPAIPAGTAEDAFPAPRIDQLNQFLDHVHFARTAAQSPDLILDGDSITDYWQGSEGKPVWKQAFGAIPMIDFAIAGDRTQHVLWRLEHGQLDGLHPKLVELMIGTNNIGTNPPEEIADGIRKIVETYRAKLPDAHILLLAVFPRGANADDGARKIAYQVNDLISKMPWDDHVTYLDIGAKFLGTDGAFLPGTFNPQDNVHPIAGGYKIWADAVKPVIDQYCPVAAGAPVQPDPTFPTPDQAAKINATLPTMSWPFPMTPPAGTSSAIFPVPHSDWFYRFVGDQENEKKGPYDFVLDGDSITDNWQPDDRGRPVWKQRWANIKVLDNAIGGDQVQHVLWRVQHGDLDGLDPKLIMLMIGTNDCGRDPKGIAQGIREIIDEYEKRCPSAHILLCATFPRDPKPDGTRDWLKAINAIISTYSSDPRVTYLDFGDKFLQPDGTLTEDIMPDMLHPSTKGYVIWADAIQPVIDKYFPGAAATK